VRDEVPPQYDLCTGMDDFYCLHLPLPKNDGTERRAHRRATEDHSEYGHRRRYRRCLCLGSGVVQSKSPTPGSDLGLGRYRSACPACRLFPSIGQTMVEFTSPLVRRRRPAQNSHKPDAVEFIFNAIRKCTGQITLVAIAPFSNVGALIDKDPATFRQLKRKRPVLLSITHISMRLLELICVLLRVGIDSGTINCWQPMLDYRYETTAGCSGRGDRHLA
jgi:hypothetical protein